MITPITGITVSQMADELEIEAHTVEMRLNRKGIKPIERSALYAPDALEKIRNVPGKGRPPKPQS